VQSGIALGSQATARAGMGVDAADYRHDGGQGVAIGNFSQEGISFYAFGPRARDILAAEGDRKAGLYEASYRYLTFGLFFADFDNDTWPDILAANGHVESDISRIHPAETFAQPCLLFRNLGNGTFADVSAAAGRSVVEPIVGRGLCRGDYDNDGRVDALLIGNSGEPRLLHNETRNSNHWISLHLIGTRCNRDAYGASVTVEAGGMVQTAYSASGASYLAAQDRRLHFGLGQAGLLSKLTVYWPDGTTEVRRSMPVDRVVTLTEGGKDGDK
jgi:hypothetical protein